MLKNLDLELTPEEEEQQFTKFAAKHGSNDFISIDLSSFTTFMLQQFKAKDTVEALLEVPRAAYHATSAAPCSPSHPRYLPFNPPPSPAPPPPLGFLARRRRARLHPGRGPARVPRQGKQVSKRVSV